MKNNWTLNVSGEGSIDAAQDMLTRFVSTLRDRGLTVDSVQVIDGNLHPDLLKLDSGEDGWQMYAYGSGDVSQAYDAFPTFLNEFKSAGIKVLHSGIVEGSLRDIQVPA